MVVTAPKERLACACFVTETFAFKEDLTTQTVIPIPVTMLAMDYYNELLKENPRLSKFLETQIAWITTHGRIVHDKVARDIALQAGQIDDETYRAVASLQPHNIWRK